MAALPVEDLPVIPYQAVADAFHELSGARPDFGIVDIRPDRRKAQPCAVVRIPRTVAQPDHMCVFACAPIRPHAKARPFTRFPPAVHAIVFLIRGIVRPARIPRQISHAARDTGEQVKPVQYVENLLARGFFPQNMIVQRKNGEVVSRPCRTVAQPVILDHRRPLMVLPHDIGIQPFRQMMFPVQMEIRVGSCQETRFLFPCQTRPVRFFPPCQSPQRLFLPMCQTCCSRIDRRRKDQNQRRPEEQPCPSPLPAMRPGRRATLCKGS